MPKACPGLDLGPERVLPTPPIWYSPTDPPLSLRDISPRKGGRGELEDSHGTLKGQAMRQHQMLTPGARQTADALGIGRL